MSTQRIVVVASSLLMSCGIHQTEQKPGAQTAELTTAEIAPGKKVSCPDFAVAANGKDGGSITQPDSTVCIDLRDASPPVAAVARDAVVFGSPGEDVVAVKRGSKEGYSMVFPGGGKDTLLLRESHNWIVLPTPESVRDAKILVAEGDMSPEPAQGVVITPDPSNPQGATGRADGIIIVRDDLRIGSVDDLKKLGWKFAGAFAVASSGVAILKEDPLIPLGSKDDGLHELHAAPKP